MGVPGCPLLAFCTASMARVRMVLMQSSSSGCSDGALPTGLPDFVCGLLFALNGNVCLTTHLLPPFWWLYLRGLRCSISIA